MPDPAPKKGRVLVIGGGATGALVSVSLAEQGYQVTAIEKSGRLGNGASSRSAACIRAQFGTPETVLGMRYSEWYFSRFFDLMSIPPVERDWIIKHNGYLWLYEDPDKYRNPQQHREALASWMQAQDNVKMQKGVGLPVELIESADEVAERWPHINPDRIIGATFCHDDGFLNHDQIYNVGFARAQQLGAKVLKNTEAFGSKVEDGRIVGVMTNQGIIEVDWVVNATNIWGPQVSRRLDGIDLPVTAQKRYLYEIKPDGPVTGVADLKSLPMTIYGVGVGRGAYSRPTPAGLLLLGWAHPVKPDYDFTDDDQDRIERGYSHNSREGGNYGEALREQIADFAPGLARCGQLFSTAAGYYDVSPDHNPIIGQDPKRPNLVHAVGFSGHGLMHAPITAALISAIIEGRVEDGRVRLPEPLAGYSLNLARFSPGRDFSAHEAMVI